MLKVVIALIASSILAGCLDPYSPPINDTDVDMLVVDGFLDTRARTVAVKLTKAIGLSSAMQTPLESGATVWLNGDDNSDFDLTESESGKYELTDIPIDPDRAYRIMIRTASGHEYASDYVSITATPPIDSIAWA